MITSPGMIATALKMFAVLGVVLGGLFIVFYLTRRITRIETLGSSKKLIRVLANQFIGVKKNICVVEVPGALLVLGVTSDKISLLSKIEDSTILEKIRRAETTRPTPSFADYLNRMASKFKSNKDA